MPRLPLLILILAAVVVISGCVGGGGGSSAGGAGVIIEAFEPDFPEVFTGEQGELRLKIRNAGSVDATDVEVLIVGVDDTFFPQSAQRGDTFQQLIAGDTARGTSGETQTTSFPFKVDHATVPAGLTVPYTPIARLLYTYHTTTVKSITFLSSYEMRSLQDSGRPLPAETISSTSGPVGIDITTKGPIRFFDGGSVTFPLEITVTNRGGGVVCGNNGDACADSEKWNKLSIDIQQATNVNIGNCDLSNVPLFRGQSNTFTCKVTVSGLPAVGSTQKLFQVTAKYGYFVEKATNVKVTGRA